MRLTLLLYCGVVLLCLGCNRSFESHWLDVRTAVNYQTANNLREMGIAMGQAEEPFGHAPEGKQSRKLVYHAEVDIVVEELAAAEQELEKLLETHEGVLANAETLSRTGAARTALRVLRIPVGQFDVFLEALDAFGEVQRSKLDVQDITRNYSELEEQIRNLTAEAEGLRELLKKPSDKLADTLAVREQLSKVTREMEGLKARLQRMQAQITYSTVTLRLLERSRTATGAPLGTSALRAFWDSWDALVATGRGTLLFGAMLGPWLPLLIVAVLPLWLWRRRRAAISA